MTMSDQAVHEKLCLRSRHKKSINITSPEEMTHVVKEIKTLSGLINDIAALGAEHLNGMHIANMGEFTNTLHHLVAAIKRA